MTTRIPPAGLGPAGGVEETGNPKISMGVDLQPVVFCLHDPCSRWTSASDAIDSRREIVLLLQDNLSKLASPSPIEMDVVGVELLPPTVEVTAEGRLRGPEGGISNPRTGFVAHLPELGVQLLPDPLGPRPVVGNRGDDEESASLGLVDGLDEGRMPAKDFGLDLLQSHDPGVPDVVGPATDDVVAGMSRGQHHLAKLPDPVVGETSTSLDVSEVRTEPVALRLVRESIPDEFVLSREVVVDIQMTVSYPVLLNQSFFDGHL